jgi:RNA polymerase sigma factor (sigma-70 family)
MITKRKKTPTVPTSNIASRDRVILEHLPLVKAIAVRLRGSLPAYADLDDLFHAGVLGLFDAATKFDSEKQVTFSSYAKHRIKGEILDSLRQLDFANWSRRSAVLALFHRFQGTQRRADTVLCNIFETAVVTKA